MTDSQDSTLYPISIAPSTNSTTNLVKIHYLGYSSRYDEWRAVSDLVELDTPCALEEQYDFNQHLAEKITSSLSSQRRASPVVKIEMTYDKSVYEKGLKMKGKLKRQSRGVEHYTIEAYHDLDNLLGCNWHYRGLNSSGDFCYVMLETVEFYLYRKRPLIYYVEKEQKPVKTCIPRGFALVFKYVRGDGPSSQFGRVDNIFSNT